MINVFIIFLIYVCPIIYNLFIALQTIFHNVRINKFKVSHHDLIMNVILLP